MDCDQDRPQFRNWRGGCVIMTEGVRLDARKNGQIAGSDVVRTAGTPEDTAQPTYGFPGTPPSAIVHAVQEFIWGMSANTVCQCALAQRAGYRRNCGFRKLPGRGKIWNDVSSLWPTVPNIRTYVPRRSWSARPSFWDWDVQSSDGRSNEVKVLPTAAWMTRSSRF